MKWAKMTPTEISLAKKWYVEENLSAVKIAKRLGRDPSTVSRLVVKRVPRRKQGRSPLLSPSTIDKLEAKLEAMIQKADVTYDVTVDMLKRSTRCKASTRTILRALHKRGIYFRPLRQKPVLTPADIEEHFAFAKKYEAKTVTWWNNTVDLIIDAKWFKVLPHGDARVHAARSTTRGTYRKKGQGLSKGHTKPLASTRYNTGARSALVLAGVGHGKVLLWEYIEGKWGGAAASAAYRGPILNVLQAECPGRNRFTVLEDNDPSGFQSGAGVKAKKDSGIHTFAIPKRSPVLNVCDYWLWSEVNKRMRRQEKKYPHTKRETRSAFLARLRRTALRLPSSAVIAAIGDMKKRCSRLKAAKGGHIEEGGL